MRSNPFPCPHCGTMNDANTAPFEGGDPAPSTGDISICFYCSFVGLFSVVDGVFSVRHMTPDEKKEHEADEQWPKVARAQSLIREQIAERARRS